MKTFQSNFTTQEQAKRLLELGVPADSADMCYPVLPCNDGSTIQTTEMVIAFVDSEIKTKDTCIPCWSVGRLIEIYCLATGIEYIKIGTSEISLIELMIKMIEIAVKVKTFDFSKLDEL